MKKKIIIGWWLGIILSMSPLLWSQEVLERIVAIVGDEIILRNELIQMAQGFAIQMGINPMTQTEEFEELRKTALQNLIDEKVLLAKAKEDTITAEDGAVEAELERKIQEAIQQLGSREKLEAYFGSPIKKIKSNYREEIRKQLIVQTVQGKKLGNIQVSRREVERFYETMKDSLPEKKTMMSVRHILLGIRPGEASKQQAIEKIREIQSRLLQGEDFEELAKQYSEDPGTRNRGGGLGFIERGTLFQSFEEAAFKLEPGEISHIVETSVGLHLIQMVEKRGDKVDLRHILIRTEVTDLDEIEVIENLGDLRNRALSGEDFSDLAKEYSQDVSTKEQGGDLGWLTVDELQVEAFQDAIDTLQISEISHPFQTQYGYHIVKLEDKSKARSFSLEEDWEQIELGALNMKKQRIHEKWIEELKKDIYIEIKEDTQ